MTAPLVLLAEDDEDVRALAEIVLRGEGYDVAAVADGQAALDTAAERTPSVAILDVSMPRMDGLEAARRLRERPETSAVPIMLLTARVTEGDRARPRGGRRRPTGQALLSLRPRRARPCAARAPADAAAF